MRMSAKVPPLLTRHICRIVVDSFGPIVFASILNQFKGHWLLRDALINSVIYMSLKFKDEIDSVTFNNLMEKDENIFYELSCLASNLKKEFMFSIFFSFFK